MNYLNLTEEDTKAVVKELNQLLAEYHVYYQKLRNFHWNVKGENFFALHEKFEDMYNDAKLKIDEIAERILTLRATPVSNFSDYLEQSKIKEDSCFLSDKEMVSSLLDAHKILIKSLGTIVDVAESKGDEGTLDLASPYIKDLEKDSWMLSSFLA